MARIGKAGPVASLRGGGCCELGALLKERTLSRQDVTWVVTGICQQRIDRVIVE